MLVLLEESELRRLASSIDFLYTSRLLGMSAIRLRRGMGERGRRLSRWSFLEIRNNVNV